MRSPVLRRVMDLAPTFAKPCEDLGILLLQQNKAEAALPLLQKAVRLDPTLEEAHFQAGKALAQLGRGQEADAAFLDVPGGTVVLKRLETELSADAQERLR